MKYKLYVFCVLFVFLLTACSTPGEERTPVQPGTVPEELFSDCVNLPSDGLLHDPFGWDNLYGSKEVPTIWWQRTPRDPVAETVTEIGVAVANSLEGKDIWIEWAKNGKRMEKVPCQRRANLQTDGVDRIQYIGSLPEAAAGDQVQYMICAGENGTAQKSVGPFSFSISAWETFTPSGAQSSEEELLIVGTAGEKPASLSVRYDDHSVRLVLSNRAYQKEGSLPAGLADGNLTFTVDEEGHFSLLRDDALLFNGHGFEVLTDGTKVQSVRFTLDAKKTDHFYGFGMKYDSLDQRGKTVDTYCVNWYKDQRGETYTPVPYYFVPGRYGLFVDSTYYSRFEMCTANTGDACVIEVDMGGTEEFELPVYLFTGDNAQIAASYAAAAGQAELPPVWAFGPWISANEWNKQSEIMDQLEATLRYQIPTSVIVIEAWSDEQTFYTFNDSRFETSEGGEALDYEDFTFTGRWPDPKGMVEALHASGIKCLLWQIPVLKYSTEATAQSVRDQMYAVERGYVLKYEDGSLYRLPGGTWFGNSLLVDFTNEEAAEWFLEKRRYLLEDIGIDGFKTDGGEFVWGRDVVASDGTKGDELRNAYPDLYAQAYYDFGNQISDEMITFSRAGGSTMQKHPLCWVGDQNSDDAAFKSAIRAALSANMSGIPFVAWDIAGFSGDVPSSELYQRSVAQAAFSPVMQVHSENSGDPEPSQARTPWNMAARKGDDACLETYRYYANLRMNLLPYIYTEAKWSAETGEPMMRSMAYAFPEDKTASEYEFQYLFGRNLLVAPVTVPNAKQIKVYLPEGIWYDFFTGERYEGGIHQIPVAVDEIPVFVREGTIIPVNTDETGKLAAYVGNGTDSYVNLGYYVFPGEGEYTWYDYVNDREIVAKTDGLKVTADGEPATNWIIRGEKP